MLLLPGRDLCSGQAHSAVCPQNADPQEQPQTLPDLIVCW